MGKGLEVSAPEWNSAANAPFICAQPCSCGGLGHTLCALQPAPHFSQCCPGFPAKSIPTGAASPTGRAGGVGCESFELISCLERVIRLICAGSTVGAAFKQH